MASFVGYFGKLAVIFGAGIYAGVYVEQNYEIPKSWDAKSLWEKFQEFTEKYKRDK